MHIPYVRVLFFKRYSIAIKNIVFQSKVDIFDEIICSYEEKSHTCTSAAYILSAEYAINRFGYRIGMRGRLLQISWHTKSFSVIERQLCCRVSELRVHTQSSSVAI